MSIERLFWWIYQLSPVKLLLLLGLCTQVFFRILGRLKKHRRAFLAGMLLVWAAAALWITLLNRSPGVVGSFQTVPLHSYREMLHTGNRELLRSNFMNAALFYPAGLVLAAFLPARRRFPATLMTMAAISLVIEVLQHSLALGQGEIDDIIHNTLGAGMGCLALFLDLSFYKQNNMIGDNINEKNHAGFRHPSGGHQNVPPGQ